MVQRTRLRGTPLNPAEIREIHDHAAKQQEATGAVNKSKLQREISFKVERETIREALAMPRPDADAEPVHETRTELPSDLYAAFLEFAKAHQLPIGNGIPQAITQPAPPPKAPAFFTPKKFTKIAFISDVHLPFENKPAVRVMFDFLADYKPDLIVFAGDIYDFYEISDFDKGPGRITTLQDEFDEGRYFINAIDELCPNVDYLLGNHEDREQRLINKNPGLFKLRSLDIKRAAELPEHWRIHPSQTHFKLGKLTALHGDIKGVKTAVHPARTLFQKLKRSCIFGHFHRFGNHLDTNYDGEIRGGFANGHLSDVSRVTSWVTCPDWQEGLSTISLCEDGGFAVQQRLIVNGRLITEGKEYTL
jgi:predicted phosphodiesterase